MINPGEHDPLYQSMKLKRAKSGGIKASSDKIKIINDVINHIKKNRPESLLKEKELEEFNKEEINRKLGYKFQSFPKFCEAHTDELMKIIDDYKHKNPYTKPGKTLDPTNFKRYLENWIKGSEALKAEMVFHVYSAEEKKILNTNKKANKH